MRVFILALVLAQAAPAALAQSRSMTEAMTCNQARTIVAAHGAAVLNTSPTTYHRFVASRAMCAGNDTNEPVYVRTRDNPQCPLSVCRAYEAEDIRG